MYVANINEESLRLLKDDSINSIMKISNVDDTNLQSQEVESIAKKKINKYLEASKLQHASLEEAGIFLLCPEETAVEFASPKGTGPLPHSSLLALSTKISEDNKKQNDLIVELQDLYGELSFNSESQFHCRTAVDQEIQELHKECIILEDQLNEALHVNTYGND
jgi:hypothetical protein